MKLKCKPKSMKIRNEIMKNLEKIAKIIHLCFYSFHKSFRIIFIFI